MSTRPTLSRRATTTRWQEGTGEESLDGVVDGPEVALVDNESRREIEGSPMCGVELAALLDVRRQAEVDRLARLLELRDSRRDDGDLNRALRNSHRRRVKAPGKVAARRVRPSLLRPTSVPAAAASGRALDMAKRRALHHALTALDEGRARRAALLPQLRVVRRRTREEHDAAATSALDEGVRKDGTFSRNMKKA